MEYGRECWGSLDLNSQSTEVPESNCSIGCAGNNSELCGGYSTLTLFNLTEASTTGAGIREAAGALAAVSLAGFLGVVFIVL